MPLSPFASEVIPDDHFESLIEAICKRPQMWVNPATFDTVCALIQGYDMALWNAPLLGLREWLVVRLDWGNNLNWSSLALKCLSGNDSLSKGHTEGAKFIEPLGRLLFEFLKYRRSRGLTIIFSAYAEWLRHQEWYDGPLREKQGTPE